MADVPSPTAPRADPSASSVGRPRSVRDLAELVAEVVGPADHAHLGVRHAALAHGAAAVRLPGHPRRRPGPPAGRRLAGARAVDLAGDGCPLPDGARARPTASQSLIRMNQDVPGHTPLALAHSPGVPPAHACST